MPVAIGLRPLKRNLEPGSSNIIGAEKFGSHMSTYIRTIFFEPKCSYLIITVNLFRTIRNRFIFGSRNEEF